jgi:hypothetical protein
MSKEAMKLAMEALELEDMACRYEKEPTPEHIAIAITALQEALAEQPAQQEPVAWTVSGKITDWSKDFSAYQTKHYTRPVYTTPPNVATPLAAQRTWVGLTDEERDDLLDNYITAEGRARAIEAKLKEKNT